MISFLFARSKDRGDGECTKAWRVEERSESGDFARETATPSIPSKARRAPPSSSRDSLRAPAPVKLSGATHPGRSKPSCGPSNRWLEALRAGRQGAGGGGSRSVQTNKRDGGRHLEKRRDGREELPSNIAPTCTSCRRNERTVTVRVSPRRGNILKRELTRLQVCN